MKPLLQVAVPVLAIAGGLVFAWSVSGMDKLRKLGNGIGKKFVGDPLRSGISGLQARGDSKFGTSKSGLVRGLWRITDPLPGGDRRTAVRAAKYGKERSEANEALMKQRMRRSVIDHTNAADTAQSAVIVGSLGRMKLGDLPSIPETQMRELNTHANPAVDAAFARLRADFVANPSSVIKDLTPGQIDALMTGAGPTGPPKTPWQSFTANGNANPITRVRRRYERRRGGWGP